MSKIFTYLFSLISLMHISLTAVSGNDLPADERNCHIQVETQDETYRIEFPRKPNEITYKLTDQTYADLVSFLGTKDAKKLPKEQSIQFTNQGVHSWQVFSKSKLIHSQRKTVAYASRQLRKIIKTFESASDRKNFTVTHSDFRQDVHGNYTAQFTYSGEGAQEYIAVKMVISKHTCFCVAYYALENPEGAVVEADNFLSSFEMINK